MAGPLRLGFLGAGAMAHCHAQAAVWLGHDVVAAGGRQPSSERWVRFSQAFPQVSYRPPADILRADDVDAVVVTAAWDAMEDWLPPLCESGKPGLMEKPIALGASSLAAKMARCGAGLANVAVGFNRRFYEPVARLRDRLKAGGLVAVDIVLSEDISGLLDAHGPAIVPHVMAFSSCHILDLALHLFGELDLIRVKRRRILFGEVAVPALHGLAETADGVPVFVSINVGAPVAVGIRCQFDDRTVWHLQPIETLTVYDGVTPRRDGPGGMITGVTLDIAETVQVDRTFKPGFVAQMQAFLSGRQDLLARPADALAVLRFMERLRDEASDY